LLENAKAMPSTVKRPRTLISRSEIIGIPFGWEVGGILYSSRGAAFR
jgi:hypothetical protein